ncbi:MAG: hypothetical protein PHS37_00990 [Candidatus Omnitrophica bacterium]|nr:hypothetical protein [Candidatus Omnitrophota bacterium]
MNGEKGEALNFDLPRFNLGDMTECGRELRRIGKNAKNMEDVANRVVAYLYEHMIDRQTGGKAIALARLFKTHCYGELGDDLQQFARGVLRNQTINPETKCLVLLATKGEKPEWNSRYSSNGHRAIPLPSEDVANKFPMIRNLVKQLGVEIEAVIHPDRELLLNMAERHFNVFFVPDALGSQHIPAQQDFVVPCRIKTVLGMGGSLPAGDVFVVILFTKTAISREVADLFETLALNIKMALLPFEGNVFA